MSDVSNDYLHTHGKRCIDSRALAKREHYKEKEGDDEQDVKFTGQGETKQMGKLIEINLTYHRHQEAVHRTLDRDKISNIIKQLEWQ